VTCFEPSLRLMVPSMLLLAPCAAPVAPCVVSGAQTDAHVPVHEDVLPESEVNR
jgi:hypothetical protein